LSLVYFWKISDLSNENMIFGGFSKNRVACCLGAEISNLKSVFAREMVFLFYCIQLNYFNWV